jgi:leucyl-tRNA synthetase
MSKYDHKAVEKRWQEIWEKERLFRAEDNDAAKPKLYILDMFPYPSAEGLHVGHPKGYTATDIITRFKRMNGYNVLHAMGYDAFGLPAENYAIKTGVHPAVVTKRNIQNIRRQIRMLGFAYDWEREVSTTDPGYYRWTQWIFLKLFERGLAYETTAPINFCTNCKTGLANEEVKGGLCARCGSEVIRKDLRQWALRITEYAEKLLEGLETVDWPESIKTMQREWIGKSHGADVLFPIHEPPEGAEKAIKVFTTRPDTLFGATYMVLAPEHPLTPALTRPPQRGEVERYVESARRKSDLVRADLQKEKTGVFTGSYCINPLTGTRIPVWIADYVLMGYGTGAIMAVPAHDTRDYEFAVKFDLPIIKVVEPPAGTTCPEGQAYVEEGIAVNSGPFDGMSTAQFIPAVNKHLEEKGMGEGKVRYKLRDWIFSRQRYWGEPIPVVHCEGRCGIVPIDEKDLPVLLPEVEKYEPAETGESPLAGISEWVEVACPRCGGRGKRETNTMPQWAGSCWYYLRYIDPRNDRQLVDPAKEKYWMPVDLYVGGAEHAVLHLLYARFWHRFLYDIGAVSTPEPFQRLRNQGMILGFSYRYYEDRAGNPVDSAGVREAGGEGERRVAVKTGEAVVERWVPPDGVEKRDGAFFHKEIPGLKVEEVVEKMSKSRGNVINPDDIVERYGADVLRLYEMFMGPLEASCPWSTEGIEGVHRFLQRAWRLLREKNISGGDPKRLERMRHKTIRKVSRDIERFTFNTAISALMVYLGEMAKEEELCREDVSTFVLLISPFAPHFAEEAWQLLGGAGRALNEKWPDWDEEKTKEEIVSMGIQVNGKLRGTMEIEAGADEEAIREKALSVPNIKVHTQGKTIHKVIIVRQVVNIVAK